MSAGDDISSTTQKFLDIFDISNDVAILKDGTVSMTLMVSAMNFGLLAEQEQDAIIYAYAALLNSLNFPIQIIISSKTKDATAYLRLLDIQAEKATTNEKRALIQRYQGFVGQLIKERNVLDKKFYVAIPASPAEVGMVTPQSVLPGSSAPSLTKEQKAAVIEKGLGVLEPRRDHLIAQFNRIGLFARQILTQEIIEFFYNSYNPEAYEGQQITNSQDYETMTVQAQTAPDLNSLISLTKDNDSKKENIQSVKDVPEAGTAEIAASAVVPKEMPEEAAPRPNLQVVPQNQTTPVEIPKQTPTQIQTQTVFEAAKTANNQVLQPNEVKKEIEVAPIVVQNQPKVDQTLPPVAEL